MTQYTIDHYVLHSVSHYVVWILKKQICQPKRFYIKTTDTGDWGLD
jgi:hypothetical protein